MLEYMRMALNPRFDPLQVVLLACPLPQQVVVCSDGSRRIKQHSSCVPFSHPSEIGKLDEPLEHDQPLRRRKFQVFAEQRPVYVSVVDFDDWISPELFIRGVDAIDPLVQQLILAA